MTKNIDNKNEVLKIVHTMRADVEYMGQKIREATAMFRSIRYAVAEGILDEEELDDCLLGFSDMMDSLSESAIDCYTSNVDVEKCAEELLESGVEQ